MAVSKYYQIIEALCAKLKQIEGVAHAWPFDKIEDARKKEEIFSFSREPESKKINFFVLNRTAPIERKWLTNQEVLVRTTITLRGYISIAKDSQGASELDFQDLIERICSTFDNNDRLGGLVEATFPLQVRKIWNVEFDTHLCHTVLADLQVQERIAVTVSES